MNIIEILFNFKDILGSRIKRPIRFVQMIFRKLAYWLSYLPFKLNFFVVSFILALGYYWTKTNYFLPDLLESHKLLFELLFRLFWVFALIIVSVSLLTLLLSWGYLYLIKSNSKSGFAKVTFGVDGFQAEAGKVPFSLSFNSLIRPLLGVVKARLVFSDFTVTDELQLYKNQYAKSKILRSGIYSAEGVYLSDRKKYDIYRITVFFEDMFRLFSLPYNLSYEKQVYTVPPKSVFKDIKILPNKTTEQTVKIENPQKVQGELFNYKNFESGDDIRRIVWKIFAKSRELVVRVPEIVDPHASEIEMFTSFHSTVSEFDKSVFSTYLLNNYKDRLRIVYETAKSNGFVVKHQPDQVVDHAMMANADVILYNISLSNWQTDQGLDAYVGKKRGGVLCVSSLVNIEDLQKVLARTDNTLMVFYIKLSKAFEKKSPITFAKLFIRKDESRDTVLKRKWLLSTLRNKVLKNEKLIEAELDISSAKCFRL
jgi:hypothetical protein